jgi:hypothetical protein
MNGYMSILFKVSTGKIDNQHERVPGYYWELVEILYSDFDISKKRRLFSIATENTINVWYKDNPSRGMLRLRNTMTYLNSGNGTLPDQSRLGELEIDDLELDEVDFSVEMDPCLCSQIL